jgi:NarE
LDRQFIRMTDFVHSEHYLYRGENPCVYRKNEGLLKPKSQESFKHMFQHNEIIKHDGRATHGNSTQNARIAHQKGIPTSGVSTTPDIDRAKHYATNNGGYKEGYIYIINRRLVKQYNVHEHIVADYDPYPEIPEDKEVILVANDFGNLPKEIVVGIIILP